MAKNKGNMLLANFTGSIGKQMVLKNYNGQTILSKHPDMSGVVYNELQLSYREVFARGVAYAQEVLKDPVKKKAYQKKIRDSKGKKGTSLFHVALKDYLDTHSRKVPKQKVETILQKYLEIYTLSDRQKKAVEYLIKQGQLTNALYQKLNGVSKATATRDLQAMVKQQVICPPLTKGAGAVYKLIDLESNNELDH